MKSRPQRWSGASGVTIGRRVPMARLRRPRKRSGPESFSIRAVVRRVARPQNSGKEYQVGISKMSDGYLRRLLVVRRNGRLSYGARRRGGGAWMWDCSNGKGQDRGGRHGQQDSPHRLGAVVSQGDLRTGDYLGDRLRRKRQSRRRESGET